MSLAEKKCIPCKGGVPPLEEEERVRLLTELDGWALIDGKLFKSYRFKNFQAPMALANQIAAIAEEEGHHPDLYVHWGELKVYIWTHKIDGLTESDFILAAKIDRQTRA